MGKDNDKTDGGILFDEMNLYYQEIRDINDRTITYVKILGVLALILATYMTFGIRWSVSEHFLNAKSNNINEIATATACYAVLGLGLTLSYFCVWFYSFLQYGRSRVHKIRYWRSISILREKLHHFNNILPKNGRAIPLQTGLERVRKKPYGGLVPKPIIRRRDYFFIYFLAILIIFMFSIPTIFFTGVLDYAIRMFNLSEYLCLAHGFYYISPIIALILSILFTSAIEMSRALKGAQFITENFLEIEIKNRSLKKYEQVILSVIRSLLMIMGIFYCFALLIFFKKWHYIIFLLTSLFLVVGTIIERSATFIFKQFSIAEFLFAMFAIILRPFTKNAYLWAQKIRIFKIRLEPRVIRPKKDSGNSDNHHLMNGDNT